MSTTWSRAHERLMAQLKVHTHLRPERKRPRPVVEEKGEQYGRRPVRISGRTYGSISAACLRFRCSPRRIYDWLASGKAEIA